MTKDTNPQAFPSNQNSTGMSLRDYFAAKAMQADLTGYDGATWDRVAKHAYEMADAMLKAREACDWSLLEATQESLREHMLEIGRLKAIISLFNAVEQKEKNPQEKYIYGTPLLDAFTKQQQAEQQEPAPPKREWVGLTKDEKDLLSYKAAWTAVEIAEATLKEKNA
jgi:hypothetical protein